MADHEFEKFNDRLDELSKRVEKLRPLNPIEARGNVQLVQPFFKALGYDMADPSVCEPEYKAGWATDNEDKVDYALFDDNDVPMMLVECKRLREELDVKHASQLAKYFANTDASVGILTNGNEYEIYLDIVKANVMDGEPFFKFDLTESDEDDRRAIAQLARRVDGSFDMDGFKSKAKEREIQKRYKPRAKQILEDWLTQPSKDLATLLEKRLEAPEGSLHELAQGWFVEFVNSKRSTQTSKTQNGGKRNGGEEPGLTSLPEWGVSVKKDLPPDITFPDGNTARIDKAFDVSVKTTGWLIDNDHLTRDSLPIHTSSGIILVSGNQDDFKPDHRPKRVSDYFKPDRRPTEVSNVFVNSNFSAPKHVENAQTIIEHADLDPRDFKGEFS